MFYKRGSLDSLGLVFVTGQTYTTNTFFNWYPSSKQVLFIYFLHDLENSKL